MWTADGKVMEKIEMPMSVNIFGLEGGGDREGPDRARKTACAIDPGPKFPGVAALHHVSNTPARQASRTTRAVVGKGTATWWGSECDCR